jgi:hypothetical protein
MKNKFIYLALFLFLTSCKKDSGTTVVIEPPQPPVYHADDLPPVDNSFPTVTVAWNSTATKLSHDIYFAEYPRVKKLGGDTMFLLYHCGNVGNEWDNIALRKSFNGGTTWTNADIIVPDNNPNYYGFANPELLVMQNGWLMLAYTGRGNPDDNVHDNIQIRLSKDRGATWQPPIIAAAGRSWEPAMIQLPNGEIQLFYSSEAKWWPGTNPQQEILMVATKDNGTTWTSPKQVAYTNGMRDGMAVPLILKNNKGIVFPIESINNAKSPWLLWSSIDAKWNYAGSGSVQNDRRWLATSENLFGGAPYLVQLPQGETLLSIQDAGGRNIGANWKKSTMVVLAGNSIAKNFTNTSYPWPGLPVNEGAYYSSMFLKDDNTVVIVTTRNFADNHSEIWWKEGRINR